VYSPVKSYVRSSVTVIEPSGATCASIHTRVISYDFANADGTPSAIAAAIASATTAPARTSQRLIASPLSVVARDPQAPEELFQ